MLGFLAYLAGGGRIDGERELHLVVPLQLPAFSPAPRLSASNNNIVADHTLFSIRLGPQVVLIGLQCILLYLSYNTFARLTPPPSPG